MVDIYCGDCVDRDKRIGDGTVSLGIFDPPFGIGESRFGKHYNRNAACVIPGYREAPPDYAQWTLKWMTEAKRVLRDNGSMYVVIGHSNLRSVLNAAHELGLHEINHLIWKYGFGVYTRRKFVTSHYHILYYAKTEKSSPTFNLHCRFGAQEKTENGGSACYRDLEDVFAINREYAPGKAKNMNKLPEELVRKLILYSSNEGDTVADFFLGNFTTAYVARALGRRVTGYEVNPTAYRHHIDAVRAIEFGGGLRDLRRVENLAPPNQGKRITSAEARAICEDYRQMVAAGLRKGAVIALLQQKYGRGLFAINNILDRHLARVSAGTRSSPACS